MNFLKILVTTLNYNKLLILKNLNKLNYLNFLSNVVTYYSIFIWFYYINLNLLNCFSFFKKIYINLNYFLFYNIKNNKQLFLYYYIMFKKQNSLLKKKFNYLHNLHPTFYKKNVKKKIKLITKQNNVQKIKLIKSLYTIKFLSKKINKTSLVNTLNGKKKLKKVILNNRKLYNFLNNSSLKISKKLTKYISKKSKLKNVYNLLSLEFSVFNVILNSNIVKSYNDLYILMNNNSIYINRLIINNLNKELSLGDVIEFYLSNKFYNYISYFKNTMHKHLIKVKNSIWYKLRLKDKNKLDYHDNNIVNGVFKNNYILKTSIPNYMEVDYYSLTIILVFKSFNFNSYSLNIKKILVLYLFKLHNWK